MYDFGLYVSLFEIPRDFIELPGLYGFKYDGLITSEIPRDFIGLPGLYGFKYDGSITPVIAIVLVLL